MATDSTPPSSPEPEPEPVRPLAPAARARPKFAKGFPANAELDGLLEAFERGDYRAVREGTAALAKAEDDDVRKAAAALRARTDPDPFAKMVLALTLALIAWISIYWVQHDGKRNVEPDRPAPSEPAPR